MPKTANPNVTGRADRAFKVIEGGGEIPPLPVCEAGGETVAWHPEAVRLWESLWGSPLAGELDDADGATVRSLMLAVHDYWGAVADKRSASLFGMVQAGLKEFGLSPLARRKMRLSIASPEEDAADAKKADVPKRVKRVDPRSA